MYLEVLQQEEMFNLRFWRIKQLHKGMNNAFSSYKLTSKICLLYLEVKLQQNRRGCCI